MCSSHAAKVEFMDSLWSDVTPEAFLAELSSSSASPAPTSSSPSLATVSPVPPGACAYLATVSPTVSPMVADDTSSDSDSGDDYDDDDENSSAGSDNDSEMGCGQTVEAEIREATELIVDLVNERRALVALINNETSSSSSSNSNSKTFVGTEAGNDETTCAEEMSLAPVNFVHPRLQQSAARLTRVAHVVSTDSLADYPAAPQVSISSAVGSSNGMANIMSEGTSFLRMLKSSLEQEMAALAQPVACRRKRDADACSEIGATDIASNEIEPNLKKTVRGRGGD